MDNLNLVDYSRQEQMNEELSVFYNYTFHVIVGCGGIGYWLAILLAMMGARNFVLIDMDKLSSSNLARLPVMQTWIGMNKAVTLRKILTLLRPDCTITVLKQKATAETLGVIPELVLAENTHKDSILVWDTTDDARTQKELSKACAELEVTYRKLGYEGWKIGSYSAMNDVWGVDANYQAGYRTTRANAVSSVLAAGFGILTQGLGVGDRTLNLKELIENGDTDD